MFYLVFQNFEANRTDSNAGYQWIGVLIPNLLLLVLIGGLMYLVSGGVRRRPPTQ